MGDENGWPEQVPYYITASFHCFGVAARFTGGDSRRPCACPWGALRSIHGGCLPPWATTCIVEFSALEGHLGVPGAQKQINVFKYLPHDKAWRLLPPRAISMALHLLFPVHLSDDPADDKWQNQTRSNDDALLLQVLWPEIPDHLLSYIGEMHEAS